MSILPPVCRNYTLPCQSSSSSSSDEEVCFSSSFVLTTGALLAATGVGIPLNAAY